jgi:uncharacterized protein (UPF0147 family)
MEQLLAKAKIKDSQLKTLITRIVSKNLSSLSEPCFYPELKKHYYELLKLTGLTEKDIKEFKKRRWAGKKEAKFATNMNAIANFYVFLLQYFLSKKDKQTYTYLMILYVIRHYANLMHKHFKYCNPDAFKYAMETLTKTHLFAREKTISNALYYMAQEMIRRWTTALSKNDLDAIGLFMRESRHRVSQSTKSFAQTYYKISEKGIGIKTQESPDEDDENNYQQQSGQQAVKLIDNITKNITVYRSVDRKAQEEARKISKINASIATQITTKLSNTKNSDLIRTIFRLYLKELKDAKQICGKDYEKHIRSLMSIKRTRQEIYFKQQINVLLERVLKDFGYLQKYRKLTNQTQFYITLFLAYYLTMLIRNNVCKN